MELVFSLALSLLFSIVSAQGQMAIYDILGREVAGQSMGRVASGQHSWTLDLLKLPPGTYIAIISIGDNVETRRLVIE